MHEMNGIDLSSFGIPLTDSNLISQIKSRLSTLCQTKNSSVFPGSQPVSFVRDHVSLLLNRDYFVCEKSDGIRYLLFCINSPNGPLSFLINRKYSINLLPNVCFPLDPQASAFHHETLLDCELLIDSENGKEILKLVIFDGILVNGENVMKKNLTERLSAVLKKVINPLNSAQLSIKQRFPFLVLLKQMHKCYGLNEVLTKVIPSLHHENDGLIFTPVNEPYVIGTCDLLLKWKPAHLNTVDFKLVVKWDPQQRPYFLLFDAYCSGLRFYDYLTPELETESKSLLNMNGSIIECSFDSSLTTRYNIIEPGAAPNAQKPGGRRYLRTRTDKDSPNDHSVVQKIIESIDNSVSQEELISYVPKIRLNYKSRESHQHI